MGRGTNTACCTLAFLLACVPAIAQSPVAATPTPDVTRAELPPSTIYADTLAPFDRTRSDIANWSDIEMAAFQTATTTANTECKRLEQTPHEGEEALALARLCAIGMNWTARTDRIAVLINGRITQIGTHDELIAQGGYYADLFEKQQLEEEIVAN